MINRISNQRRIPVSAAAHFATRSGTKLRTVDETADLFSVSKRTVQRLIKSGALPVHRLGRAVRISDADIAIFLFENRSV